MQPVTARDEPFAPRLARGAAGENYLVLLVAAAATVLLLGIGAFVTADTWLALASGRVVADGGPPSTDTLTAWTLGREWVDQQWLGQLAFYELWRAGALVLVGLAHVVIVIATLSWTLAAARRRGGSPRHVALVGLLAVVPIGLVAGNIRTQTFALPLFVGLLLALSRDSRTPSRRVLLAFPLLVVWANVHGSVVLGAGLVGLAGAIHVVAGLRGERSRAQLLHGLGLIAIVPPALLATPYGLSLFAYLGDLFGNGEIAELASDWMPTTLTAIDAPLFALAGVTLVLIGRDRRHLTAFEQLALVLLLLGALAAGRNIGWFALAALLMTPALLTRRRPERGAQPPPLRLAAAVSLLACVAVVGVAIAGLARMDREVERRFPPAAADVVARAVAGADPSLTLFTHPRFADWLIFRHPQLAGRIPFDIRYELLTEEQLRRFRRFRDQIGADWREAAGGARLVVLDSSEKPLDVLPATSTILLREPGARRLYSGHDIAVIERPTMTSGDARP